MEHINLEMVLTQEEDFIAYMFGFQDSNGASDIPKAVAGLEVVEERLSGSAKPIQAVTAAQIVRLRFRRTLLEVSPLGLALFNLEIKKATRIIRTPCPEG